MQMLLQISNLLTLQLFLLDFLPLNSQPIFDLFFITDISHFTHAFLAN